MTIALYVGRFQPLHKGHYNRMRVAIEEGYVEKVVPVLFGYTNNGAEIPTYHHFLTFKEREQLFKCIGFEPLKFEVDVSRRLSQNLEPGYMWRRRKELLGSLDGDNVLITNSPGEVFLGIAIFQLPMVYVPRFNGEADIKGEEIRKLLLHDRIEEATNYLPSECRETFIEIVRRKNMKRLYQEREYNTQKFGPFKITRTRNSLSP